MKNDDCNLVVMLNGHALKYPFVCPCPQLEVFSSEPLLKHIPPTLFDQTLTINRLTRALFMPPAPSLWIAFYAGITKAKLSFLRTKLTQISTMI